MSKVSLAGNASGTGIFTIASPNSNTDRTLTLPDNTGTLLSTATNLAGLTGVGKVLQVVQSISSVDVTTTSTATVITASITPSSSASKILTFYSGEVNNINSSNAYGWLGLSRSGSSLAGIRSVGMQVAANLTVGTGAVYLDSPFLSSAITYTLTVGKGSGGTTSATCISGATIVLMEIAG